MLFNSIFFIAVFLPVAAFGFFGLSRLSHHLAGIWLCVASLAFYGWWNINYIWLLLSSVVFNYGVGYLISHANPRRARLLLTVAITGDLALLGYYKYIGFFTDTLDRAFGIDWSLGTIILPLGISFFTFTQIAFLVDAYRGKAKEYNFVHYLLFVTYFPHLIAGPILHHAQMMPQFAQKQTYRLNWANIAIGISIFTLGLTKKVLFADNFSTVATPIFQAVGYGGSPMLFEAWVGALAYTLQLYFDFSGYSDMAIGISYIFNIKLPLNFNSPYKAVNIIDFWRRWHMTLSAFLRDYLYFPLGGNRKGPVRRYVNLMITMLLGGLWHGAGWTFVAWGGLHGFYLIGNHAFQAFRVRVGWRDGRFGLFGRILSVGFTFILVVFAWVFFRSSNFSCAERMVYGLFGLNGISLFSTAHEVPLVAYFLSLHGVHRNGLMPLTYEVGLNAGVAAPKILTGLVMIWAFPNTQEWMRLAQEGGKTVHAMASASILRWEPERWWTSLFIGFLLGCSILTIISSPPSEFLYFQF